MKSSGEYAAYLHQETMRVVTPYLVLAGFALLWCVLLLSVKFPAASDEVQDGGRRPTRIRDLLNYPHFYKGVISQFFYCGAQTCTWSYFIQYTQDYTGLPEKMAGYLLTGTLVAFGAGRFSATYFMKYIAPGRLMGVYGLINILLVAIAIVVRGSWGVWALLLTSFFMSLMYPTNFALSLRQLGDNSKIAGSIMVMAIVGGAIFPPVVGLIAVHAGSMALAMVVPLLAYIYITYYGFSGSRLKGN
jgi:FHS family L-fucose permease-like MFS transporter